ncbi:hypothetical protein [Rhizobium sp. BK176]|uniref:hypothetical protein n=1 Tax=Rhizobium sp. BK176 TaxID=2587071 RepID=UPI0021695BE0|nr:hypothetical protein [Rhizobium sp. BK176]MCS4090228.1 hypothetical protein [Rhizobium sp. BK176]
MKLTFRHLALVKAKLKGGRVARHSVILPEGDFHLNVLDGRDAPVVMKVTTLDYADRAFVRDVRAFRDGLYRTVGKESTHSKSDGPETLDSLVEAITTGPLARNGFKSKIVEAAGSIIRRTEGEHFQPPGITNALTYKNLEDDSDLVTAAIQLTDQIAMDDEVTADIASWRQRTQQFIDRFIVVDGTVFKRCGEPIYELHASEYSAYLGVSYLDEMTVNGIGPHKELTFAATSADESQAALALAATWVDPEKHGSHRPNRGSIEVLDSDFVRWRAEERDFDRFARRFERTMGDGIDTLRERHKSTRIPRRVYDAWLDLREALDAYDGKNVAAPEGTEETLVIAIDTWRSFKQSLDIDFTSHEAPSIGSVDNMLQRFVDRPIEMGPVVGYTGGPSIG